MMSMRWCRPSHEERGLKLDWDSPGRSRCRGRSSHEERGLKFADYYNAKDKTRRSSHEERGLKSGRPNDYRQQHTSLLA